MTCTEVKDMFESVEMCYGQKNIPGICRVVYAIPMRQIVKWPKLPSHEDMADGDTSEKLVTITESFVLAEAAKWLKLDIIQEKSPVSFEPQGEQYSGTFLNKATLKLAAHGKVATAFCAQVLNESMAYLVQEKTGAYRLLGAEFLDTVTKPSGNFGESVTGDSGMTLEITATDKVPAPYYEGEIVTEDGTINPDAQS